MRKKLKSFRAFEGMSQEQFSEKIGVTRCHYSHIERGECEGSYELWKRLQEAFDIPDAEMWGLIKNE